MREVVALDTFLAANEAVISVGLAGVKGSSPREVGAEMLVSAQGIFGSIGGGQLEYMAIDEARALLANGAGHEEMDVPLGPEIGQCCGGRVKVQLLRMSVADKSRLRAKLAIRTACYPLVLIFGAGHVGRALVIALSALPMRVSLIDSRADELAQVSDDVDKIVTPLPEQVVRDAPPNSAFIVLTHDHSLDFMIAADALARGDAAYVGMIGSATKRATFANWCKRQQPQLATDQLVCPIGKIGSLDKRPEVIAALVAAEILTVFAPYPVRAKEIAL